MKNTKIENGRVNIGAWMTYTQLGRLRTVLLAIGWMIIGYSIHNYSLNWTSTIIKLALAAVALLFASAISDTMKTIRYIEEEPENKENKIRTYRMIGAGLLVVALFVGTITIAKGNTLSSLVNNVKTNTVSDNSSKVSSEYKNALSKAKLYSDTMYMSKQGIYKQLISEYGEGFSKDAAQYAVDNLDVDYNANALKKAKLYRDDMNMSKNNIYKQLISEYGEEFTKEEAQYAIDHLED